MLLELIHLCPTYKQICICPKKNDKQKSVSFFFTKDKDIVKMQYKNIFHC